MEHIIDREKKAEQESQYKQLSLSDITESEEKAEKEERELKELELQKAMLGVQKKYGRNVILKGMNLEEGATARDRNKQIGGHKA